MRRLQEFEPLPIGRPVPGIAGFKLYGEGGPSARREAQIGNAPERSIGCSRAP